MIFFFGGGWTGGNVFSCVKEAEHFAKRGVVVGLADYRVRNRHGVMLDKCAEDARSAVRWLRANWQGPRRGPGARHRGRRVGRRAHRGLHGDRRRAEQRHRRPARFLHPQRPAALLPGGQPRG